MARNRFRDGAAVLATYEWAIGFEEEDPDIKQIPLEHTALTTGVGFVRQQGTATPPVKKVHGWINDQAQLDAMTSYYNACAGIGTPARTIFWQDIDGTEHEVLITEFAPQRKRRLGPGLPYNWQYSLTMEVIT